MDLCLSETVIIGEYVFIYISWSRVLGNICRHMSFSDGGSEKIDCKDAFSCAGASLDYEDIPMPRSYSASPYIGHDVFVIHFLVIKEDKLLLAFKDVSKNILQGDRWP